MISIFHEFSVSAFDEEAKQEVSRMAATVNETPTTRNRDRVFFFA